MGRPTLRDPRHPRWPKEGQRTEVGKVAKLWADEYVKLAHRMQVDDVFGLRALPRLSDAIERYREHRRVTVESSTYVADGTALAHLTDEFGDAFVDELAVQPIVDRLLRSGYQRSTVKQYVTQLRAFWGWLELPFPPVKLPKVPKADVQTWTDAEVKALRKVAGPWLVALDCTLYMGLRESEVWGLRWSDIRPDRTVRVTRQWRSSEPAPKPLKGKQARTAVVLPGWRHEGGDGYVVGRVTRHQSQTAIKGILRAAGIDRVGEAWHMGRHTYARWFLESKPEMRLLQASLGHESVTTTERTYNPLLPDRAAEMAKRAMYG